MLRYLSKDPECILERTPLTNLAHDHELHLYRHEGFWACMDTQRDREHLNQLWNQGKAPWLNMRILFTGALLLQVFGLQKL